MKTMLKRTLCLLLCAAIAVGGLWVLDRVTKMKRVDGILTMQNFYAQPPGTVDVLLVGNSHSGINVDTATLWQEYGIASYNLWGGVQPFWNSYHFIVEALKYQTPQLIALEVTPAISDYEYSEDQNQIKNTAGMKFSRNRWEAVKVSAPKDKWLNLMLGFPMYHNRFDELEQKDFQNFPWSDGLENFKGSYLLYGVGNYVFESADGVTECREIMEKQEEYLLKIIELCSQKQIPLLLFKTPALERTEPQKIYNTVDKIASEHGLRFLNMNLMDTRLGITSEDYSLDRHMNGSGARKVSHYLGQYLQENYRIPDRRGENGYESWDVNAAVINNDYLAAIEDTGDYFRELAGTDKVVLLMKNSPVDSELHSAFVQELSLLGMNGEAWLGEQSCWMSTGSETAMIQEESLCRVLLKEKELCLNFEYQDVSFDGKKLFWYGDADYVIVVYDPVTESIVDSGVFTLSNGYRLQRST